jgi:uncharacterized protein (TIGR00369 family)
MQFLEHPMSSPTPEYGVISPETALSRSGLELMRAFIAREHPIPPFTRATGIIMTEADEGRCVFEGEPSEDFYNPLGTVHGGWTAAILDSALGCCVHTTLKPGETYTTVEMKVHYIRPLFGHSGTVRCEGVVVHRGGRIATSEAKLVDSKGKLIAHGTETCLIMTVNQPTSPSA